MENLKIPSWTTTKTSSVCEVGPWRIEFSNSYDHNGCENGWQVDDISGPLVPADECAWPDMSDMDLPEMQLLAVRFIAVLAATLSALQPFLQEEARR